jgi:hypothetical protein
MAAKRGYVIVACTVGATVLQASCRLATDGGYPEWQKSMPRRPPAPRAQGGGLEIVPGMSNSSIVVEGQNDAALNGFVNGSASATVRELSLGRQHRGRESKR